MKKKLLIKKNMARILLVEDDQNLTYFIRACLKRNDFYVRCVSSGKFALKLALRGEFDLIIADLGLPEMNGYQLIKKLREKKLHMPIIVVTSQTATEKELSSFEAGANLFHKKPINFELLIMQIKSIIKPSDEKFYRFKDVLISPYKRYMEKSGKEIKLTKSEFELIINLLESDGKVFNRTDIMQKIFNKSDSVEQSTIDTLISRLRKKLEKHQLDDLIETVYRSGYRINSKYIYDLN